MAVGVPPMVVCAAPRPRRHRDPGTIGACHAHRSAPVTPLGMATGAPRRGGILAFRWRRTPSPEPATPATPCARAPSPVMAPGRPARAPTKTPAVDPGPHPRPPRPERDHRVGPSGRRRGGRCERADPSRPGRPGPPVTLRSTVKPFGTVALLEAGGARGVRPGPARGRAPRQLALRRGPACPDAAGALPPGGGRAAAPRLRDGGHAARRADRRPPRTRRGAAQPGPSHVLRAARGVHPPGPPRGLAARRATGRPTTRRSSPIARRSPAPMGRRPRPAADRDRRLRRR